MLVTRIADRRDVGRVRGVVVALSVFAGLGLSGCVTVGNNPPLQNNEGGRSVVTQPDQEAASLATFKRLDSREQVRTLQQKLGALGFDAGIPDGIAGPRTAAAVREYQSQNGLTVNGRFDDGTTLRLVSASVPSTPPSRAASPPATRARVESAAAAAPLEARQQQASAARSAEPRTSNTAMSGLDLANINWSQQVSANIPIKRLGGHLWEDTPLRDGLRKRRWVSAKGLCERLTLLGVDRWTLATTSQLKSLRTALVQRISKMNPENVRNGAPDGTRPFLASTTGYHGNEYWTIDGKAYSLYKDRIDNSTRADRSITYEQSEATRNHYMAYWLPDYRCVNERTLDLPQLYTLILAGERESAVDRSLPSAPTPPSVRLTKDEFEKTADFEARKAASEARAAAAHAKAVDDYQKTMERRRAEIARAEEAAANNYQLRRDAYEKAFNIYYGIPHLSNVSYNADTETFSYEIVGNQVFRLNQKVPIEVAEKYKAIITARDFRPTVMVSTKNGTFTITGIKELVSPVDLVRQTEFEEAYGSVDAMRAFASKYPGTDLARKAQLRATELRDAEARRQQAEEQRRQARVEAQRKAEEQERQAHMARKAVGDKVCMRAQMYFGLISPTLSGYVEAVNGDNIRIRIANTEGTTPNYNGVTLRQGVQIWDSYQSWGLCN